MSRGFVVWGLLVLVLYGWAEHRGLVLGGSKRGFIPQNVRQSPGGYRSYIFWRGGK